MLKWKKRTDVAYRDAPPSFSNVSLPCYAFLDNNCLTGVLSIIGRVGLMFRLLVGCMRKVRVGFIIKVLVGCIINAGAGCMLRAFVGCIFRNCIGGVLRTREEIMLFRWRRSLFL